jgi:hypothetical protein
MSKITIPAAGLAVLAASIASPAIAEDNAMAEAFAAARLAHFAAGDTAALTAQYAEDAVVISPMGVLRGRDQIRAMIEGIIAEFGQPGVSFELLSQNAVGPVVAFTWTATTGANVYELGAETYVIEDGLATYQTFAARVAPR